MIAWVPLEFWIAGGVLLVVATSPYWLPVWNFLPKTMKIVVAATGVSIAAYLRGLRKGSSEALQKERERNEAEGRKLVEEARAARERQRGADAGGVRDDADPFRRD